MILRDLLDPRISLAEMDPARADETALPDAERRIVAGVHPARRARFAAGRLLARALLAERGFPAGSALLPGPSGAPLWPPGIRGSITHGQGRTAVALASAGDFAGLGIDLLPARPLPDGPLGLVAREEEIEAARAVGPLGGAVLFGAKEAVIKAAVGVDSRPLAPLAITIVLERGGSFAAEILVEMGARRVAIGGRWRVADGQIAVAVTL
ncbi:MAG: phosphopantetheinyl transferase [Planctomycetota bacterium]